MNVHFEPEFLNLPTELKSLFAAASTSSFFSQAAWYDLMTQRARISSSTIRLYSDSTPPTVGLVMRSEGYRRLHGFSNAYSLEYAPIMSAGIISCDPLRELIANVAKEDPSRERITFAALDPASDAYAALVEGFRLSGWSVKRFFDCGVWYEDTTGLGFSDYISSRPSILRNTFRRKEKAAAAAGTVISYLDDTSDLERMIEDYETIYQSSWKPQESFTDFIPNLIRLAFALGALRMCVAYIDGQPVASQFWLIWRGRAVIYKLAHSSRFDHLSLGTILTMRMMERVLDRDQPAEINFGRGDDPYKKIWLSRRRERWGLYAANPRTLRGAGTVARWLAAQGRNWAVEQLRQRH
jgi:hypothetical protein